MKHQVFYYEDEAEAAMTELLADHGAEAKEKDAALLDGAEKTEGGCLVTSTSTYAKVQLRGHQWPAYRFILCVLEGVSVPSGTVVRHRCHNRLCINPEHLQFGTQGDNRRDDVVRGANGIDFDYL
jgi:hypothetical protein